MISATRTGEPFTTGSLIFSQQTERSPGFSFPRLKVSFSRERKNLGVLLAHGAQLAVVSPRKALSAIFWPGASVPAAR